MTEKKQKQITILAAILGMLTLSFIVIAGSGVAFVVWIEPTPTRIIVTVNTTPIVIKAETMPVWGPGTPSPTPNRTKIAENVKRSATAIAEQPHARSLPTSEPFYAKTMKRLKRMEIWGSTLALNLVLIIIISMMLYSQLNKRD